MGKKEFIAEMAEKYGITKVAAAEMYDMVFSSLIEALEAGFDVAVPSLGKFVIKQKAERICRNPATGEEVMVPAKMAVSFKVSKTLKDAVAEL